MSFQSFVESFHFGEVYFNISSYASILEVFLGVGFGFFALSKVENVINSIISQDKQETFNLINSIDSAIELTEQKFDVDSENLHNKEAASVASSKQELNSLKIDIQRGRNKVVFSSKFNFLNLGLYCFYFLLLIPYEEYLIVFYDIKFIPTFCLYYTLFNLLFMFYHGIQAIRFSVVGKNNVYWQILTITLIFIISLFLANALPIHCNFGICSIIILLNLISPFLWLSLVMRTHRSHLNDQEYERKIEMHTQTIASILK